MGWRWQRLQKPAVVASPMNSMRLVGGAGGSSRMADPMERRRAAVGWNGGESRSRGGPRGHGMESCPDWVTGLCLVARAFGALANPQPTHPPTYISKVVLRKNLRFINGARNWRPISGTQTCFFASDPPEEACANARVHKRRSAQSAGRKLARQNWPKRP